MAAIGYALSSEEHGPLDLVRFAARAEQAGFSFISISDHFHPWIDAQGQSPFVWSVLGGISQVTERVAVGTGVTCPTVRIHPAVIAQAAATAACMLPGRFFLGVGTGENLNEHILGDHWPPARDRLEMLEEAVEVLRLLWQGGVRSHRGKHYRVENARIYTLPETTPPIIMSAFGPEATEVAARIADGFWSTGPDREAVQRYEDLAGTGKPKYAQVTVCWASDEASARKTVHQVWPNAGIPGQLSQELAQPAFFEQAATLVGEDEAVGSMPVGPDPERHLAAISEYLDAGYDHVYIHQVGRDQDGFFRFYEREVLPKLG